MKFPAIPITSPADTPRPPKESNQLLLGSAVTTCPVDTSSCVTKLGSDAIPCSSILPPVIPAVGITPGVCCEDCIKPIMSGT